MIRSLAMLLLVLSACSGARVTTASEGAAPASTAQAFGAGNGSAAFLKNWRWVDIHNHLNELRAMGFTAIMISPHTATCGADQSDGYDPSDFTQFLSRFGSQDELQALIDATHATGMQIYASMVMNHMCAHGDYQYARFGWNDFHHYGAIQSWSDTWWLENGDLFGLNDLCQECDYVRGELFNYLVKTNDMGFDGYRFDAGKHVPHWYWQQHVMSNVNAWGKYGFGEVYDANLDVLQSYVDIGMSVTDYALYFALHDAFAYGGDLSHLDGAGYAMKNGQKALTFVENQDVSAPQNRALAYAFIAAYPGCPMFMSPTLGDPLFSNLAWIHDNLAAGSYLSRWAEHDVLIFERQGSLLAGFNQNGAWQSRTVATSWANTRLHDFSGSTGDVWTGSDARVELSIPPVGYVLLAPN